MDGWLDEWLDGRLARHRNVRQKTQSGSGQVQSLSGLRAVVELLTGTPPSARNALSRVVKATRLQRLVRGI